jgi:hypothetical protein
MTNNVGPVFRSGHKDTHPARQAIRAAPLKTDARGASERDESSALFARRVLTRVLALQSTPDTGGWAPKKCRKCWKG